VLKALSMVCKAVEKWIACTFALYMKSPGSLDAYDPQYKEDFAPRGEMEDLKMLQAGLDDNISPMVNVEIKKAMTGKILSNLKDERLQELYDDIDEQADAAVQAQKDMAARAKEAAAGGMQPSTEGAGMKAADAALQAGGSTKVAQQDTVEQ
jgi:hypothetical protein